MQEIHIFQSLERDLGVSPAHGIPPPIGVKNYT